MPKKRQHFRSYKPVAPASPALASTSHTTGTTSTGSRSVNDILANLRRTSAGPPVPRDTPVNAPSVPPAIREILQIPETPSPAPRRRIRARFDQSGRRLPAGPPPPRSWTSDHQNDASATLQARLARLNLSRDENAALPGISQPARGSLIDLLLRNLAANWEFQRDYNQYHLYFLPTHLKPALIRLISLSSNFGVSLADLKLILLPPTDVYEAGELEEEMLSIQEVTYLDLSFSLGKSIRLKELTDLLFPQRLATAAAEEPQDSWDAAASASPSPPKALLPNLTHLSLALDPTDPSGGSWKQLLALSSKASSITHLSLAFWPDPCLTPRSRHSSIASPQGRNIPYGGTNTYSHTLDHDWSEAVLVLRKLSRNLYELEYLDLTGCEAWFEALTVESDHDYVDWTGSWGKISELKLNMGVCIDEAASVAAQSKYLEIMATAAKVEKHIRAMRAGKGRFINVERQRL